MNSTVYRIPSRKSRVTLCSPRTLPAVHQHAATYAYAHRVHACARHRQVLSNRRVLSIINVYRMRNRVQARPRYHPPLFARPSSAVHLRCWPAPSTTLLLLLLARFCAALSFRAKRKRFHENSPPCRRRFRVANAAVVRPAVDYFPCFFFSLLSFFSRSRNGARAAGWKRSPERTNERTNEGADGVFLIFLLTRAVLSFVTKPRPRREARRAGGEGGGGGEGAQGREMIFSPELNYGRAMECACYSFAALR